MDVDMQSSGLGGKRRWKLQDEDSEVEDSTEGCKKHRSQYEVLADNFL